MRPKKNGTAASKYLSDIFMRMCAIRPTSWSKPGVAPSAYMRSYPEKLIMEN